MSDSTVPAGEPAEPLIGAPTPPPTSQPPAEADRAPAPAAIEPQAAAQAAEPAPAEEVAPAPLPELKEGENMRPPCNCQGAPCAAGEVAANFAGPAVIIRHGLMQQIGQFRHDLAVIPPPGTKVVIRTERGVEMGEVVSGISKTSCQRCITQKTLSDFIANNGPEYPFRREGVVLRVANPQDIIDHRHLETSAREEATYCRQQLAELALPMRLVTVEHLLGGERIIFYFTAETRVDFRELVRRIAAQFRTRIEMRQVGARDEARIIADYERCGQRCCCQQYLKDLRPVSMRMAKTQKATLDPSKISGRCGRLMCCLRYEDVTYEELRKQLPRKNTWVKTEKILGKVVDTQIITQLVRLALLDNTQVVVGNEEILERDVPAPPMPPPQPPQPERHHRVRGEGTMLRDTINPPPAAVAPQGDAGEPAPVAADAASGADESAPVPAGESAAQEAPAFQEASADGAPQADEGDETAGPDGPHSGPDPRGPGGEQRQGGRRRRRHRRRGGGGGPGQGPGAPQGSAGASAAGNGAQGGNSGGEPRMGGQGQGGGGGQGGEGRGRRRRRHRGRGGSGSGPGGPGGSPSDGGNSGGGGGSPPPPA